MKKILSLFLIGLIVFSMGAGVFAQGGLLTLNEKENIQKINESKIVRYELLKEFSEEIHEINELRVERNNLRNQVIEKNDLILDLYIDARENGNKEALKEAKEVKKQIREINTEIKNIHTQISEERKLFKAQVKEGNIETARVHINNIISLRKSINEKIGNKIELLDNIIDILS